MNLQKLKKSVAGAAVALALIFGSGIISAPAQAHDRGRYWQRDRDERQERSSYRLMQMQRMRELQMRRRQERDRNRYGYQYGARRNNPYYGGYNSAEVQRGYRNGLKEGGDDARDRDSFNPNRHSSYRDGNASYRQGFGRGYAEAYRLYARYRGW